MRKKVLILGHNDATQFIDIYNEYSGIFDREQYEVTIAYLTGEPSEQTKKRTLSEHILFLNIPNKTLRGLKVGAIFKLLRLTRQHQYDIVICHRYKPTYIMMWVALCCRIRLMVCVMHELHTMQSMARQLFIGALKRQNILFAGVSNAVRDDMRKSLWCVPNKQITTLYNMIDVSHVEPQFLSRHEARAALHLPDNAFVFGNIARLAPNKDQQNLIHAFSLIKPYCQNAKLIIIGDGSLENTLKEQVAQYKLTDDVIFTGFLPGGFRYMKAFDCFILNSIQEAFGRVLLEAMIAKLPIIATRVNGIPEVVGQTATLIKASDTMELSAAMKNSYLTSTEKREEKGLIGYQRVVDHFSMPQFYHQFWQQPFIQAIKE